MPLRTFPVLTTSNTESSVITPLPKRFAFFFTSTLAGKFASIPSFTKALTIVLLEASSIALNTLSSESSLWAMATSISLELLESMATNASIRGLPLTIATV